MDDQRFALLKGTSRLRGNDDLQDDAVICESGMRGFRVLEKKTMDDQRFALLKHFLLRGNDDLQMTSSSPRRRGSMDVAARRRDPRRNGMQRLRSCKQGSG